MSSYPNECQDRLEVLYGQEVSFYLTSDYLSTLIHRQDNSLNNNNSSKSDASCTTGSSNSKMLNQHWREVMCEWAYHGK